MFENLRIKDFRLFDDLEIRELKRINLLAGRNNSGKTAVLEAMFLLAGMGSPNRILEVEGLRGATETQGAAGRLAKAHWKPLFSKLDMLRPIEISGSHSHLGRIDLKIFLTRRNSPRTPEPYRPATLQQDQGMPSDTRGAQVPNLAEQLIHPWALHLSWDRADEHKSCDLRVTDHDIEIVSTEYDIPFQAVFVASSKGSSEQDAVRLSELRARKQGDLLTKALRIVEPRLESVEGLFRRWRSNDLGRYRITPSSHRYRQWAKVSRGSRESCSRCPSPVAASC